MAAAAFSPVPAPAPTAAPAPAPAPAGGADGDSGRVSAQHDTGRDPGQVNIACEPDPDAASDTGLDFTCHPHTAAGPAATDGDSSGSRPGASAASPRDVSGSPPASADAIKSVPDVPTLGDTVVYAGRREQQVNLTHDGAAPERVSYRVEADGAASGADGASSGADVSPGAGDSNSSAVDGELAAISAGGDGGASVGDGSGDATSDGDSSTAPGQLHPDTERGAQSATVPDSRCHTISDVKPNGPGSTTAAAGVAGSSQGRPGSPQRTGPERGEPGEVSSDVSSVSSEPSELSVQLAAAADDWRRQTDRPRPGVECSWV